MGVSRTSAGTRDAVPSPGLGMAAEGRPLLVTVDDLPISSGALHPDPDERKAITREMFEAAYGCPVDLVAHGHAHRVFEDHQE